MIRLTGWIWGLLWVGFSAPLALAGGWISTGGEIYRDGRNPWFVENVSSVNYCVAVDPLTVSASPERVRELVSKGIENWKREFQKYYDAELFADFYVGTQEFIEVPCSGSEDLKVQLGWGTLNQEQRDYIVAQGADGIVGLAVRTDYDVVHLRGRGFIYIASDSGEHRYQIGSDSLEQAWRYEGLLYYVIAHELGHVFGLPHVSPDHFLDSARFLMVEQFPEYILRKASFNSLKEVGFDPVVAMDFNDFFQLSRDREVCNLKSYPIRWFGLPAGASCVRLKRLDATKYLVLARGAALAETLVGQIDVTSTRPMNDSVLSLYLDPAQKVYPFTGAWPTLYGPGFSFDIILGLYTNYEKGGAPRAISATFNRLLLVTGEDNGQMTFVLR